MDILWIRCKQMKCDFLLCAVLTQIKQFVHAYLSSKSSHIFAQFFDHSFWIFLSRAMRCKAWKVLFWLWLTLGNPSVTWHPPTPPTDHWPCSTSLVTCYLISWSSSHTMSVQSWNHHAEDITVPGHCLHLGSSCRHPSTRGDSKGQEYVALL